MRALARQLARLAKSLPDLKRKKQGLLDDSRDFPACVRSYKCPQPYAVLAVGTLAGILPTLIVGPIGPRGPRNTT